MEIVVYTQPACPKCDQAKAWLTNAGHPFETVDITKDTEGLEYISSIGALTTPVVRFKNEDDDKPVFGFNIAEMADIIDEMEE
ncbi:glutaredoxin-like NrdH protein [Bacillus phage v_B-Bak6]|uniref:Glutaredoxin-like NrdH protein n=1 Tax=Bacillus phage v_B-Bak10 TaxID=2094736 RepID=A0A385IK61_9CAUD|nr:thioredoxin domain [Bacillus phage v_B-Bak10]AXY82968.1 glutaredoxin-like NrdH protein [Bacillus phage v_B-Bak1]AXY83088.1 glutaredoxin-like NrdH protein [Bacillus phage v_B-Bak6]AXY83283.1 glutaredoxin-like NrdH protein [Bacillus phage v_B-Bak10]